MGNPKLTKAEIKMLKSFLTEEAIHRIAKRVKVSARMVKYVRDGVYGDRHGIIDLLIREAKVRKDLVSRRKSKLNSLTATPASV